MFRKRSRFDLSITLLFFGFAFAIGFWHGWFIGSTRLIVAVLWTIPVVLLIAFTKHRKHVILSALGALAGYSILRGFLMRNMSMAFAIAIPTIAVMFLIYTLFPDKKNMDWLYEDPPLGEGLFTQLDLSTKAKPGPKQDKDNSQ